MYLFTVEFVLDVFFMEKNCDLQNIWGITIIYWYHLKKKQNYKTTTTNKHSQFDLPRTQAIYPWNHK